METAQDWGEARDPANVKVCIVGASGKIGQYMAQHALDRDMRWSACAGSREWRNSMRSRGA
jgi:putative NADH-flavin reductase